MYGGGFLKKILCSGFYLAKGIYNTVANDRGDWILETGIWNDSGGWIDTELWID